MKKLITYVLALLMPLVVFANWEQLDLGGPGDGITGDVREIRAWGDSLVAITSGGVYLSQSGQGGDWFSSLPAVDARDFLVTPSGKIFVVSGGYLLQYNVISSEYDTVRSTGLDVDLGDNDNNKGRIDYVYLHHTGVADEYFIFGSGWNKAGIYRSKDDGVTWDLYDTPGAANFSMGILDSLGLPTFYNEFTALNMLTASNGLLMAHYTTGLLVSKDNGDNWYYRTGDYKTNQAGVHGTLLEREFDGEFAIWLTKEVPSAGHTAVAYSSVNDTVGQVWEQLGDPIQRVGGNAKPRLANHSDRLLFGNARSNTVVVTHDNGVSWRPVAADFPDGALNNNSQRLYVAGDKLFVIDKDAVVRCYDLLQAPSWVDGPAIADTMATSVELAFEASHYGTAFVVVLSAAEAAPSAEQVIAGQDASGDAAALTASYNAITGQAKNEVITGLSADTEYTLYVVYEATNLQKTAVTALDFKTPEVSYSVQFTVNDGAAALEAAQVVFNGDTLYTNASGIVIFPGVLAGTRPYEVSKLNYTDSIGTLDVTGDMSVIIPLKAITYQVTFTVTDGTDPIEGANVLLGAQNELTDAAGVAVFEVMPASGIAYEVTKTNYLDSIGTVDVIDQNVELNIALELIVSITEIPASLVAVYPNPTSGLLRVATGSTTLTTVNVFDALGTLLTSRKGAGTVQLNLSAYPNGVYFIQFEGKSFRVVKK